MKRRTFFTTALAAAVMAGMATTVGATTTALVNCGKVRAAGTTWHVMAGNVRCATARTVVRQVAIKKPDRVLQANGGEIDQYLRSFSGLKCVKSRQANVGRAINCTSNDGRRTVLGVVKG